jgi:group II intron reverse transcriptase/maturase
VKAVLNLLRTGHQQVIDADLSGYFDSIPHAELMKCVSRRVSDKHVLHLIKMWLDAPVEEKDEHGNRKRTTSNRDTGRGTPQGAVISPLLSNLYMRRFILGWKKLGYARRWSAHIVNYADDYVICCKGQAEEAMSAMREMMMRLKLTINEKKTHVCRLPQERFDFLGYTFGRCYSPKNGHAYISVRPSRKSIKRMVENITRETRRSQMPMETDVMVERLNRKMNGWANYFCLGPINSSYRALNTHAVQRFRRWLCKKHKVEGNGYKYYPDQYLHESSGLVYLPCRTANLLWAKA